MTWTYPIRMWFVLVSMALLSSCGDPLDARYATTETGSINGCSIFKAALAPHCDLRAVHLLSPRLEEQHDLLIHVARQREVPDAEACDWIESWLLDDVNRQAVLVLRNGSLTTWLCRRWARQARAEADRVPKEAESLRALATQLDKRADADEEPSPHEKALVCSLFSWKFRPAISPTTLTGLGLSDVPLSMSVGGFIEIDKLNSEIDRRAKEQEKYDKDKDKKVEREEISYAKPLIQAHISSSLIPGTHAKDEFIPWAVEIPMGNFSRLVVVSDALPLLDGAQPDPAARKLMQALITDVVEFHGDKPRAAWVNQLRVREESGPPNPLVAVLTTAPIAWISWHLIALLIVIAFSGAGWLGRRDAPRDDRHDRFSRHVLALAARLRETQQASWCVRAIARVTLRHRELPPSLPDEASARDWLKTTASAAISSSPPNPSAPKRSP